jgi:hypothetical protein
MDIPRAMDTRFPDGHEQSRLGSLDRRRGYRRARDLWGIHRKVQRPTRERMMPSAQR